MVSVDQPEASAHEIDAQTCSAALSRHGRGFVDAIRDGSAGKALGDRAERLSVVIERVIVHPAGAPSGVPEMATNTNKRRHFLDQNWVTGDLLGPICGYRAEEPRAAHRAMSSGMDSPLAPGGSAISRRNLFPSELAAALLEKVAVIPRAASELLFSDSSDGPE